MCLNLHQSITCVFRNFIELLNKILYKENKERTINNIPRVINNKVVSSTNNLTDQLSQISRLEKRLQKLEIIIGSDKCILVNIKFKIDKFYVCYKISIQI